MARSRTVPLDTVRDSVSRLQKQGERAVAHFRRDAKALVARRGAAVLKEFRELERRLMGTLHAATTEQVGRLERRVRDLEEQVARLRGGGGG